MKYFVIAERSPEATPDKLSKTLLEKERRQALRLMGEDFIREIYNHAEGTGGIMVVEAEDDTEVRTRLETLPMVKQGLLKTKIYCIKPWRAFIDMAGD